MLGGVSQAPYQTGSRLIPWLKWNNTPRKGLVVVTVDSGSNSEILTQHATIELFVWLNRYLPTSSTCQIQLLVLRTSSRKDFQEQQTLIHQQGQVTETMLDFIALIK